MAFGSGNLLNLAKQAKPLSISLGLLALSIQTTLAQVPTNTSDIAEINAKIGAANGIASLDANSKLPVSMLPAMAIGETFTVAAEADLTGLTAQTGDVAIVTGLGNFRLAANDATDASNWLKLVDNDGVDSILVDGIAQTGQVSLHKIAESGQASDVEFSHAAFAATDAAAAIVEVNAAVVAEAEARATELGVVSQSVTDEATARGNADNTLQGNIDTVSGVVATKVTLADMKLSQVMAGTIDGTNKVFEVPEAFAAGSLRVWMNNAVLHPDTYTLAGEEVTFVGSPDPGDAMWCDYVKAAA